MFLLPKMYQINIVRSVELLPCRVFDFIYDGEKVGIEPSLRIDSNHSESESELESESESTPQYFEPNLPKH